MQQNGWIGLAFGAYYGLLFQSRYLKSETQFTAPTSRNLVKALGRLGVVLVLCSPFFLIYFVIADNLTDNEYILMFLKYPMPLTAVGFIPFGVSDRCSLKLGFYDAKKSQDKKNQDEMIEDSDDEKNLLLYKCFLQDENSEAQS